jgi:glycine/D-amino acid oxidase-like deaminating enzyme
LIAQRIVAAFIVIGSSGLGAATAYYLSKRKALSVALIDNHDVGSQTSPRAAGMGVVPERVPDDQPHQGCMPQD